MRSTKNLQARLDLAEPEALEPKTGLGGLPVADVGMRTGATIHTEHGLWMRVLPREPPEPAAPPGDGGFDAS